MTPAGEKEAERGTAEADARQRLQELRDARDARLTSGVGFGESYGNDYGGSPSDTPPTPANNPALREMLEDNDEEEEVEDAIAPPSLGFPPLRVEATGSVRWPNGRYREGTTIRELETDLLEDALNAGGGVSYGPPRSALAAERGSFFDRRLRRDHGWIRWTIGVARIPCVLLASPARR